MRAFALAALLVTSAPLAAAPSPVAGPTALSPEWQGKSKTLFKTAIEIPTVQGRGEHRRMADMLVGEYRKNGWTADDVKAMPYKGEDGEEKVAFYARWKAAKPSGKKPILLIAHMDVVEAKRADWVLDPFVFVEKDGYFYGRGTSDDKQGVIGTSTALFKLRSEGFKPTRDIIVFYTVGRGDRGRGRARSARPNGEPARCRICAQCRCRRWRLSAPTARRSASGSRPPRKSTRTSRSPRPIAAAIPVARAPTTPFTNLSAALKRLAAYRFEPGTDRDDARLFHRAREAGEGRARRCDAGVARQ